MSNPVRFLREEDATALSNRGRPMSEEVLTLDVGPCSRCGRTPEQGANNGILEDTWVENGVLRGKATCEECLDDE